MAKSLTLITILVTSLFLLTIIPARAAGSADYSFASWAFRQMWERQDLPVVAGQANRSFTWGNTFAFLDEPYVESANNQRLVQYFDKARMEISFLKADPTNPYYVTNGLLVREMVAGQVQVGDNNFTPQAPATIPVAGDPINIGPTYRSFRTVASLIGNNQAIPRTGAVVKETINQAGFVSENEDLVNYGVKYNYFSPELSHNIADVFWNFMNQRGLVYLNGQYTTAPMLDWVATMGLPITEAYWARVIVGGVEKDVLMQLFERRILTYTPANPAAYQVEMGNVGQHYYAWRYPNRPAIAPWSAVNITNNSNCDQINVELSGQDNLTVGIGAGGTNTYKLGPGTYDYVASGCDAEPKRGTMSFRPNQNFDWSFSISKQIV